MRLGLREGFGLVSHRVSAERLACPSCRDAGCEISIFCSVTAFQMSLDERKRLELQS